jgi:hypothetical protein
MGSTWTVPDPNGSVPDDFPQVWVQGRRPTNAVAAGIGKTPMMTKAEHTRYIQSARWKARAAQYLRRHPRCVCGRRDQLQVHHLSYDHAGEGKEPDRDLLTLCRRHHELAHEYERSGQ